MGSCDSKTVQVHEPVKRIETVPSEHVIDTNDVIKDYFPANSSSFVEVSEDELP